MEALWRWTSSVFLVLALNIGCIQSQNAGSISPLPAQTFRGEQLSDCNLGLVDPPPQMNNMFLYPLNGLAQGEANALELQRQALQEANIPTLRNPCGNQIISNEQVLQSGVRPNLPGSCLPFHQTMLPQNQCPMGELVPSCLLQPNAGLEALLPQQGSFSPQSVLTGPLPTLSGPLTPFTSAPNVGFDVCPGLREKPSCSQLDPSPYPNILPNLGYHFTPLVPINPALYAPSSCSEVLPLQGVASPTPQDLSQMCAPIPPFPFNNQGVHIDGVNCLSRTLGPQCDISPEPLPCAATTCPPPVGPSQKNNLPFPQFRLPRLTLFQSCFQGPVTNHFPIQCEKNDLCPPTNIQGQAPVCVNTAPIQQEPICRQRPKTSACFEPNYLQGLSPNLQCSTLQASAITPLSINPCATEEVPNFFLPPPLSQPCPADGFAGILPQMTNSANCLLPPVLPSAFNGASIESTRFCPPVITEASPTPISLQINVPPPVIPAPRITIINATPTPVPTATDSNVFDMPYAMPPMIIEGGRSSSRSWLPLILVALFAGDGNFGGCGGCDSGSIPIPYPIPIPTNNPVIVQK